jgi:hypothetical protein
LQGQITESRGIAMKRYGMTGIPNYIRYMREPYVTQENDGYHDRKRKFRRYLRGRERTRTKAELRKEQDTIPYDEGMALHYELKQRYDDLFRELADF